MLHYFLDTTKYFGYESNDSLGTHGESPMSSMSCELHHFFLMYKLMEIELPSVTSLVSLSSVCST